MEIKLTYGSLFTGVGGFDLGLDRAGMKCNWQVEIDRDCRKVLKKHWPRVKKYKDIKNVKNLESVDLICGGFPCQPYSIAGKRRGADDDRALWPEMFRIIQEARPAWIIGENVPGILSMEIEKVLSDLESIGFDTQPFVIPACAVNAPHRRDRVWIIAYSDSNMRQKERSFPGDNRKTQENKHSRIEPLRLGKSQQFDHRKCIEKGNNDGISRGMVRRRAIGNAVVPQIPEIFGRMIKEIYE